METWGVEVEGGQQLQRLLRIFAFLLVLSPLPLLSPSLGAEGTIRFQWALVFVIPIGLGLYFLPIRFRIRADQDGMEVQRLNRTKSVSWQEVGWFQVKRAGQAPLLRLYNHDGSEFVTRVEEVEDAKIEELLRAVRLRLPGRDLDQMLLAIASGSPEASPLVDQQSLEKFTQYCRSLSPVIVRADRGSCIAAIILMWILALLSVGAVFASQAVWAPSVPAWGVVGGVLILGLFVWLTVDLSHRSRYLMEANEDRIQVTYRGMTQTFRYGSFSQLVLPTGTIVLRSSEGGLMPPVKVGINGIPVAEPCDERMKAYVHWRLAENGIVEDLEYGYPEPQGPTSS